MKYITTPRQIGCAIREQRRKNGLTQEELAETAQVSRSLIMRLEKGSSTALYPEKLIAVLDALSLRLAIADIGSEQNPPNSTATSPRNDTTRETIATRNQLTHEAVTGFSLDESLLKPFL